MTNIENIGSKFIGGIIGLFAGVFVDVILIQFFEILGKPELFNIWEQFSIPLFMALLGAFHKEINDLIRELPSIR